MTGDKTGPDATPRIGLDLGRQIFDDPSGSDRQGEWTGPSEERIRQRAHEIWESEGCSGDPQDHWFRAERELSETKQERSEITMEDAPPAAAAGAAEAVESRPTKGTTIRLPRRGSKRGLPRSQSQPELKPKDTESGKATPGMAQVGNQKVPRPDKVSDRSVPDDIDE